MVWRPQRDSGGSMDKLARLVAKRHTVILMLVAIAVARVAPASAQTTLPLTSEPLATDAASNLDALVREAVAKQSRRDRRARALAGA
jgi:hypothetical protein